jgi:hypothetical protein
MGRILPFLILGIPSLTHVTACGGGRDESHSHSVESSLAAKSYVIPPPNPVAPRGQLDYPILAPSWAVGFNSLVALNTVPSSVVLPNLPGNSYPQTLATVSSQILSLAGSHHVGLFRDIIPVEMLAPTGPNDQSQWRCLHEELEMMKNYNVYFIFALGRPLPSWMSPSGAIKDGTCFIPESPSDWTTLKNNMSGVVGTFLAAMAYSDPTLAAWMETHLIVEPFNELDSLSYYPTCAPELGRRSRRQGGGSHGWNRMGGESLWI